MDLPHLAGQLRPLPRHPPRHQGLRPRHHPPHHRRLRPDRARVDGGAVVRLRPRPRSPARGNGQVAERAVVERRGGPDLRGDAGCQGEDRRGVRQDHCHHQGE